MVDNRLSQGDVRTKSKNWTNILKHKVVGKELKDQIEGIRKDHLKSTPGNYLPPKRFDLDTNNAIVAKYTESEELFWVRAGTPTPAEKEIIISDPSKYQISRKHLLLATTFQKCFRKGWKKEQSIEPIGTRSQKRKTKGRKRWKRV
jgi:hypothetical protein